MVPAGLDRRRLRAAVRHQPPRPLRADQPAAAARRPTGWSRFRPAMHRAGHVDLADLNWQRRPLLGHRRLRAVEAGQPALHPRAAAAAHRGRIAGARAGGPSRVSGHQPAGPLAELGHRPRHEAGQRAARAVRRAGRPADAWPPPPWTCPAAATSAPSGWHELRGHPTLVGRTRVGQRPGAGAPAVGGVGGAHRRRLPRAGRPRRALGQAARAREQFLRREVYLARDGGGNLQSPLEVLPRAANSTDIQEVAPPC